LAFAALLAQCDARLNQLVNGTLRVIAAFRFRALRVRERREYEHAAQEPNQTESAHHSTIGTPSESTRRTGAADTAGFVFELGASAGRDLDTRRFSGCARLVSSVVAIAVGTALGVDGAASTGSGAALLGSARVSCFAAGGRVRNHAPTTTSA